MKLRSIKVFTDRYPWLGPLVWILSIEFFVVQLVVAAAWQSPSYSWRFHTISDLGSTICGTIGGRPVCSPLHILMNASLITLGLIIVVGSTLIYQEFRENPYTLFGFSLMGLGGIGAMLAGIFPENTVLQLHLLGAFLPFAFGNLSLLILGAALFKVPAFLRVTTLAAGSVALIALYFFIRQRYGGLGIGGTERLVAYPQIVWLVIFGLYMSRNHILYSHAVRRLRHTLAAAKSAARHLASRTE